MPATRVMLVMVQILYGSPMQIQVNVSTIINNILQRSYLQSLLVFIVFQTLTGESHNIWDITYEELKKLNIKSTLTYG